MKKIIPFLFSVLFINVLFGQINKTVRKAVEIQKEQNFYLTTTNSRAYIPIYIPENTVQWFIAFSSTADEKSKSPINLLAQVSTKLLDKSGISSIVANSLTAPSGTAKCNIMVADLENRRNFMNLNQYTYYDNASRDNLTHGIISVSGFLKGSLQVLLYNPSFTTSINVSVEITAIVEEESIDLTEWSPELKGKLFDGCKNDLLSMNIVGNAAIEISNCFVEKITTSYTLDAFSKMSTNEIDAIGNSITKECIQNFQGGPKTEDQEKGASYGKIGWQAYQNGDVDKAILYSLKAIELDKNLGWVNANLGLFYLIKGDEFKSTDYYLNAIQQIKKDINGKSIMKEVIEDIEYAITKYESLSGSIEIYDLLKKEYRNFP